MMASDAISVRVSGCETSLDKLIPIRRIRRQKVVGRVAELLRLCRGKKVLHLGCADYPYTAQRGEDLLHRKLFNTARELWGFDASAEALRALQAEGFPHLVLGDVEQLDRAPIPRDFEVIVAGELIEHLASPGNFLRSVAGGMGPSTELVLTTPNAFGVKGFIHSLMGREKVHPDHNYYFSYYTITQLMEKFGLRCGELYYYQDVRGRGIALAIDRALAVVPRLWPILADGLFVRATLASSAGGLRT